MSGQRAVMLTMKKFLSNEGSVCTLPSLIRLVYPLPMMTTLMKIITIINIR
jgi:hypothetical protein